MTTILLNVHCADEDICPFVVVELQLYDVKSILAKMAVARAILATDEGFASIAFWSDLAKFYDMTALDGPFLDEVLDTIETEPQVVEVIPADVLATSVPHEAGRMVIVLDGETGDIEVVWLASVKEEPYYTLSTDGLNADFLKRLLEVQREQV